MNEEIKEMVFSHWKHAQENDYGMTDYEDYEVVNDMLAYSDAFDNYLFQQMLLAVKEVRNEL